MSGTVSGGLEVVDATAPRLCDVCGAVDSLGLGSCPACAGAEVDSLLFLARASRRADRDTIEGWLADALDGLVRRERLRDVAAGERPLVRLAAQPADRAVAALASRGVLATRVEKRRAWTRLPLALTAVTGLVLVTGALAGILVEPRMLLITPLFAGLLTLAGIRRLGTPVWTPEPGGALALPDPAEGEVRATLARLGRGRARGLLKDVSRLASGLYRKSARDGDAALQDGLSELLRLSCSAALDLEQLDHCLEILDDRTRESAAEDVEPEWAEAVSRATETRDALLADFTEALAALGRAQAATTVSANRLVEIADRLEKDARGRAMAWQEVQRLLA